MLFSVLRHPRSGNWPKQMDYVGMELELRWHATDSLELQSNCALSIVVQSNCPVTTMFIPSLRACHFNSPSHSNTDLFLLYLLYGQGEAQCKLEEQNLNF